MKNIDELNVSKFPILKVGLFAFTAIVAICVVDGSYFKVQQNEVGAVLRFGALQSVDPLQPGLHFKVPFIDEYHVLKTSIEKIPINGVKVKTIDNQFVSIDFNLTYHSADPLKVLFKVGDIGNSGVHDKLIPYVQSRALDEFGKVNALQIADQKAAIEGSIWKDVRANVLELFGENIDDVQITGINYDPSFEANVQEMVKTRNAQVSSQNTLIVRKTEAQQAVAVATGVADAAIATAEGDKQKAIKAAEANAAQTKLQGDAEAYSILAKAQAQAKSIIEIGKAEADVITEKVGAAGDPSKYAEILRAEASKNWNGSVPQYNLGSSSPVNPILMVPNK